LFIKIHKQIFEGTGFRINKYVSKLVSYVIGVRPSFMKYVSLTIHLFRLQKLCCSVQSFR